MTSDAALAGALTLLVVVTAAYALPWLGGRDGREARVAVLRAIGAAGVLLLALAPIAHAWLPALGAAGVIAALPALRRLARRWRGGGLLVEVTALALLAGLAAAVAAPGGLRVRPLLEVPLQAHRLLALELGAATCLLALFAGRYLVDELLEALAFAPQLSPAERAERVRAAGGLLEPPAAETADQRRLRLEELERTRVIGYLERLLVLPIAAAADFGALGFLMAAKGLVRSEKLKERHGAEYFLIGTLASVALGVAGGLALRWLHRAFW